jgi:hypothetical protein
MSNPLYEHSIPPMAKSLGNLSAILDKGAAFCAAKKIDESVLVNARLAPDMFPLGRQVQIACDTAKRCAGLLGGVEVPKHEDSEKSFAELKERIRKTLDFIATVKPEQVAGKENADVTVPLRQPVVMKGINLARHFSLPNVYFHVATAYDILRHNGVEVGKRDFLGSM